MSREVDIPADGIVLRGVLEIPEGAHGAVLFAHGAGSDRHSPRNNYVAGLLRQTGLATLLMDLLTDEEEAAERRGGRLRFDIGFLAHRLSAAAEWLKQTPETRHLPAGYFGASTGSAAALVAAVERPERVGAIVSRGGRPDLAAEHLSRVEAPTLLIVGGRDETVLELNRAALDQLRAEKRLEVVPGAGHLFEEPGALEDVADLSAAWFGEHLR